jgi:6-phosphofructokinase 1
MGRHFSDLAIKASIALNATYVVTEDFIPTAAQFAELHRKNLESGEKYSLFIITENIYGKDGRPTLQDIAKEVGELTNNSMSRVQVLGYLQRGGTPTAFDRFQTMRMGEFAIECIKNNIFNISVGIKNDQLIYTDIQEAVSMPRKKHDLYFLKKYPII